MIDPDLPEDPDAIWGNVTMFVDPMDVTGKCDNEDHNHVALTLRIENHGLPVEKFIDGLLMAATTALAGTIEENTFNEGVPDEVKTQMAKMLAQQFLANRIKNGNFPDEFHGFAIPAFVDFEGE